MGCQSSERICNGWHFSFLIVAGVGFIQASGVYSFSVSEVIHQIHQPLASCCDGVKALASSIRFLVNGDPRY